MLPTTSPRRSSEISLVAMGFAPGGFFVEDGDVHIAEMGQRQRARDRRCRHDEHIHRLALGAERQALMHAETVLFVDHGEAEILEDDVSPETAHACR